jgi:spermidine synthase
MRAGLGSLVFRTLDDIGEIHVCDDRQYRYLTFGNAVEQSCMDMQHPARLQHVYTQAMMLGLLLSDRPRTALVLGVGGGSLVRALRDADRGLRITGIEQRRAVLDTARAWFGLPDDRRCRMVCDDAAAYVVRATHGFDLILSDLFLAEGASPTQATLPFLSHCQDALSDNGVLLVNLWASDSASTRTTLQRLHEVFREGLLTLHVQGGNIIACGFRSGLPQMQRKRFLEYATALGERIDCPLQRHARNLWRQNAAVLRGGRNRR